MKKNLQPLRTAIIFGIGSTLSIIGASIDSLGSRADLAAAALYQTPTPTPQPVSQVGSTDGIMLMSLVIAIIILLPIVLHKSTWTK
jgi:hypothetical protein